ncbi:MAG: hypothetical protein HOB51_07185 [Thaumarchaeota archaeon]|nr:hypothetical protein [Nitrososphaerota archaeon]
MANSLLDDVNELLRLSYGDENRLEDIKRRLEDGLTIYSSDINYLKKLVENHKDEIQENTGSKNNEPEPEPEPYEQYQPEPDPVLRVESSGFSNDDKSIFPEEQSETKKTAKTAGVIILSTLVLILLASFAMASDTATTIEQPKVTIPKVKSFNQMSDSELSVLAVDWNFRDLLRSEDSYLGKIIFVDGTVSNIHRDLDMMNLCINMGSYSCDDFMFVNVNGITTWLENDRLSGYVEVKKLTETGSNNVFTKGEWVGSGEYVPRVKEIRLICSNC